MIPKGPLLVGGIVIVALGALVLTILLKGGVSESGPTITALVSFIGLLVAALVQSITLADIGRKVNGHLAQHVEPGHTDEEIRALVTSVVRELTSPTPKGGPPDDRAN